MMGKNDPYGNYYYDPRTNGVWRQGLNSSSSTDPRSEVDPILQVLGYTG
jgi:hypothetical protein